MSGYVFQEYPKSLHMNGDWNGDHVIVRDADEEGAKRSEGYRMLSEPKEEAEEKQPSEPAIGDGPKSIQQPEQLDDALKQVASDDAPKRRGRKPRE